MNERISTDVPRPSKPHQWAWTTYLKPWEIGVAAGVGFACIWLASLAILGGLQDFDEEAGVIELLQSALLATSLLIAAISALRLPRGKYRSRCYLMALLALAVFAREADFHIVLNPQFLGDWGIRYRADWVLDGDVSIWLKLGWLLVLATPIVMVVKLVSASRIRPIEAFSKRSIIFWFVLACVAFYAIGYAMDDLFGRGQYLPTRVTVMVEESSEILASFAVLLLCLAVAAAPGVAKASTSKARVATRGRGRVPV